jgi:transposase
MRNRIPDRQKQSWELRAASVLLTSDRTLSRRALPVAVAQASVSSTDQGCDSLAAWIGLVPKQHSTGGKERLGGISKQGNRYLRWLLVAGAMAVTRYARQLGTKRLWLARIMERRPIKVAAVALANKIARMTWAMMVRGQRFKERRLLPA